jgi:hypothetical protein
MSETDTTIISLGIYEVHMLLINSFQWPQYPDTLHWLCFGWIFHGDPPLLI